MDFVKKVFMNKRIQVILGVMFGCCGICFVFANFVEDMKLASSVVFLCGLISVIACSEFAKSVQAIRAEDSSEHMTG